jgi:23S rRNA G2445 N2-methylase RlmL
MHMPAIEAAVLGQGFAPGAARERLSLDFRAIPYADLWRKWSSGDNEE